MVGDTLPGNQQGGGTAPLNTPARQMQMEETENTMFALQDREGEGEGKRTETQESINCDDIYFVVIQSSTAC